VNGKGKNMLGVLLMEVRDELRQLQGTLPKRAAVTNPPKRATRPRVELVTSP
jgi:hypothetical protein